jgi:hypothetical protein
MRVQRAYKSELDLTDWQVTACKQHAGAARWAYNWGLRVKQERYQATKRSPNAIALHRELNALKKTQVPWMYKVSKCAPQLEPETKTLKHLGRWTVAIAQLNLVLGIVVILLAASLQSL